MSNKIVLHDRCKERYENLEFDLLISDCVRCTKVLLYFGIQFLDIHTQKCIDQRWLDQPHEKKCICKERQVFG